MATIPWWLWAVAAAIIGFAELHAPGAYLIWIAIGAAATAGLSALWQPSIPAQVGDFGIACVISCLAGYFVYRRFNRSLHAGSPLNQRDFMMVGMTGVVCASLLNGRGKVRLGDTVWIAEGPDLREGTPVVVTSVRGTALVVEAA